MLKRVVYKIIFIQKHFIIQESDSSSVVFTFNIRNHRVSDDKQTLKISLSQICSNKNSENVVELKLPSSLFKQEEKYYNSNYISTFLIRNSNDSSVIVNSNCYYVKELLNNIGNNAKKNYSKLENYKLESKEINNN